MPSAKCERKEIKAMTYQAPEVLDVGRAEDVIQGAKEVDSESGIPLRSATSASFDFED